MTNEAKHTPAFKFRSLAIAQKMSQRDQSCLSEAAALYSASKEAKHTPAPWKLGEIDGCFINIDSSNHIGLAKVVWLMNDDRDDNTNSPAQEANARLIAAAPETAMERDKLKEINAQLLSALKVAEKTLEEFACKHHPENRLVFDLIKEAIEKAEGQE